MKPSDVLKPGMIGIEVKTPGFAPGATGITMLEGDTVAKHVWIVLPNGKIGSTGADKLVFYGEADPDTTLKGKTFYLAETVDPMTEGQLAIIQAAHDSMMKSGLARFYGIWKFPWLLGIELFTGFVSKSGFKPTTMQPVCPICSQIVAYFLWKAGVPVGQSQGNEDWSAVLPKTFLIEAKDTSYSMAKGWLDNRQKPCYLLKLVQAQPFRF